MRPAAKGVESGPEQPGYIGGQGVVVPVVNSYCYRGPRVAIELPVEFCVEQQVVFGRTINVSELGVLVVMEQPLAPDSTGVIRLRLGNSSIELGACVTHVECFEAGMRFSFTSERESDFVRHLVKALYRSGLNLSAGS